MENFVLSCCSTADLSLEHFQNRNIHYICFHYELNGTVYPDDLGQWRTAWRMTASAIFPILPAKRMQRQWRALWKAVSRTSTGGC